MAEEKKVNPKGFRNSFVKARNERRRKQRREEAEERNAKWQQLTPEQQLAYCEKHGGRAKQVAKLKKKLEKQDAQTGTPGDSVRSGNDDVQGKRRKRASRHPRKKGGGKVS